MSQPQYANAINAFLSEFLDSYVIFGTVAASGKHFVIRCDNGTSEARADLEKQLTVFLVALRASRER